LKRCSYWFKWGALIAVVAIGVPLLRATLVIENGHNATPAIKEKWATTLSAKPAPCGGTPTDDQQNNQQSEINEDLGGNLPLHFMRHFICRTLALSCA
jgi:hypothetical protein